MTTSIQWGEFCPEEVHHTVHRTYEYIFIIWRVLIFFVSLASFQFGIKHNRQKKWNDGGLHHDEVEEGGVVQGGDLVLARMLSSLLHLEEEHESRKQVIRVLLGSCPLLKKRTHSYYFQPANGGCCQGGLRWSYRSGPANASSPFS